MLYKDIALANSTKMCYTYDELNRVTSRTVKSLADNSVISTETYTYDAAGNMIGGPADTTFVYDTNNRLTGYNGNAVSYDMDGNMLSNGFLTAPMTLPTGFVSRRFLYAAGEVTEEHVENVMLKSSPTTQLVSQIVLTPDRTISYEYDAEERITKVIDSVDGTTEYTYDALGQLLTETRNGTVVNTMTYDNYGNILTKNGVEYTYGDTAWKDLLTGYGNQAITYDAQGNPTSYLGHTLTWEKGRQLKSFDSNTYTYNANGIRTSKTVDGVKHTYLLDGTRILREEWGANTLIPLYDNEDSVCGILYNEKPFYFQKNLQGDVIALVNKEAEVVAQYAYDAWGVCTITQDDSDCQIATVNPFRYRGYYYDEEIGLYYLQSRYYNAVVGRFVNADDCISLSKGRSSLKLSCESNVHE